MPMKLRSGMNVLLTTGTIYSDIQRTSKTGSRWVGTFTEGSTCPPGYIESRKVGVRYTFSDSCVKCEYVPSPVSLLYPHVLSAIRESLGLEPNDGSQDGKINIMTPRERLDAFLSFKGIIGYTDAIQNVLGLLKPYGKE